MAHLTCFLHSLWHLRITSIPKRQSVNDLALEIKSRHFASLLAHLGLYLGPVLTMHLRGGMRAEAFAIVAALAEERILFQQRVPPRLLIANGHKGGGLPLLAQA
jgi:hypothetical protein